MCACWPKTECGLPLRRPRSRVEGGMIGRRGSVRVVFCFAYYYKPPFPEASLTLSLAHASSPHRLDTSTLGRLSHTHFHYAYHTLKYSHVTNTQKHTFKIRRRSSR